MNAITRNYLLLYLSPILKYIGVIFFALGGIGLGIIAVLLYGTNLNWKTFEFPLPENAHYGQLNLWLPYLIPGIAASLFIVIGLILLIRYYSKRKRIVNIINKRKSKNAVVTQNIQNFHVQVNNIPRREVSFKTEDGKTYTFKFFSEQLASLFRENETVPIITDKDKAYPSPMFMEPFLK